MWRFHQNGTAASSACWRLFAAWRWPLYQVVSTKFVLLTFAFGLLKLLPTDKIKNAANITLLLLMFLAVYSHYMVSDPFERSGPALVFTFMLGGRFVVWYQVSLINPSTISWKTDSPFRNRQVDERLISLRLLLPLSLQNKNKRFAKVTPKKTQP